MVTIDKNYFPIIRKALAEKVIKLIGEMQILSIAKNRSLTSSEYLLLPINMQNFTTAELVNEYNSHTVLVTIIQMLLEEINDEN